LVKKEGREMTKPRYILIIFSSLVLMLVASKSFAGNFTLPFNGSYPVSAYYDLDPAVGKTKGYNNGKTYDGHTGTDYALPNGTPVLAMDDGKVVKVENNFQYKYWDVDQQKFIYVENTWDLAKQGDTNARKQPGNHIIIEHPDGTKTSYLHFEKGSIPFKEGDQVKRGDVIGSSDNTGASTGPHLDIKVRDKTGEKYEKYGVKKIWGQT
jgi:murein DD-endopeptidase MepM/ murein hydrolase activator NlpD